MNKNAPLKIMLETDLKNAFDNYCESNALNKSELLRAFMRIVVKSDAAVVVEIIRTQKIDNKLSLICFERKK